MKLEEVIKNLTSQYEAKVKQVNQLVEALEKAKVELQQLSGAYQLATQLKEEEDKEAQELKELPKKVEPKEIVQAEEKESLPKLNPKNTSKEK